MAAVPNIQLTISIDVSAQTLVGLGLKTILRLARDIAWKDGTCWSDDGSYMARYKKRRGVLNGMCAGDPEVACLER